MDCRYCGRRITFADGGWIDPEATGDDVVWRETCDAHDTFEAEHAPDEREGFHYAHGGWSEPPGREACAVAAAEAERWAELTGLTFEWRDDWGIGSHREFYGEDSAYADGEPETCEVVVASDATGRVVASLGCVDDATAEYRRVVEAELAMEALSLQAV